jgi:hypothetical protein
LTGLLLLMVMMLMHRHDRLRLLWEVLHSRWCMQLLLHLRCHRLVLLLLLLLLLLLVVLLLLLLFQRWYLLLLLAALCLHCLLLLPLPLLADLC